MATKKQWETVAKALKQAAEIIYRVEAEMTDSGDDPAVRKIVRSAGFSCRQQATKIATCGGIDIPATSNEMRQQQLKAISRAAEKKTKKRSKKVG